MNFSNLHLPLPHNKQSQQDMAKAMVMTFFDENASGIRWLTFLRALEAGNDPDMGSPETSAVARDIFHAYCELNIMYVLAMQKIANPHSKTAISLRESTEQHLQVMEAQLQKLLEIYAVSPERITIMMNDTNMFFKHDLRKALERESLLHH